MIAVSAVTATDPPAELLVPEDDVADPQLSIVIPALDEALTITDFVAWCREGMDAAGVRGEILIVDSSTDHTPRLAVAAGARVLRVPKRGLGRAYMDATPFIRGEWVLMGDADCTYDFRRLEPFVEAFRDGYEYVDGLALERLHRAGRDAEAASVPRHTGDDVDPEPAVLEPIHGHPLRDARDHPRRSGAHGSAVPVLGVRVGDRAQVRAHGPAHHRGAGALPEGQGRPAQPPQALGLALALVGGLDQPARDVRLRVGLLRAAPGARSAVPRSAC